MPIPISTIAKLAATIAVAFLLLFNVADTGGATGHLSGLTPSVLLHNQQQAGQTYDPGGTSSVLTAPAWAVLGSTGRGVKVGIIDWGFEDFTDYQGVLFPEQVRARCYQDSEPVSTGTISHCAGDTNHGSAVAEAVLSVAPEVTLYIANPHNPADTLDVVEWMIDQEVDVINYSISWLWDGPGNGTSPREDSPLHAVDKAVAGGIAWLTAAGNSGRSSWLGQAKDRDNDGFLEFRGKHETNWILIPERETLFTQLRWEDEWGQAQSDLDLHLFDDRHREVASSREIQNGSNGDNPTEVIKFRADRTGYYYFKVRQNGGELPEWLQLVSRDTAMSYEHTTGGGILNPGESSNPGSLTVGASTWPDLQQAADYSSSGPTPDGLMKPDIIAPAGLYSEILGGPFHGTSQASAHAAGITALVLEEHSHLSPAEVASYLRTTLLPMGESSVNNPWRFGLIATHHAKNVGHQARSVVRRMLGNINAYLNIKMMKVS